MSATYFYAVRYEVAIICLTPLRTGNTSGDVESVLRGHDGRAFLQGSSLAGALRDWMDSSEYSSSTERLWGSQRGAGKLLVSDAVFTEGADQYFRPRLRIDGVTGAADQGGKFDVAHIGAGAMLEFTLTWLGMELSDEDLEAVEQMLSALDCGEITLGAQKSNGFGRVSLTVKKHVFDLKNAVDRSNWLADMVDGAEFPLPERKRQRAVTFTLNGCVDSLLVKSSAATQREQGSCTGNIRESGYAILPGSSVKGAVRARVSAIAELMGLSPDYVEGLFGRASGETDNGLPGRVRFMDIHFSENSGREVSRIRIDRFTGGVMRGGLFREAPISGRVESTITTPDDPICCSLLLLALRDLGLGLYALGSGSAIGRGYIALHKLQVTTPAGQRACLQFDEDRFCTVEDPCGIFQMWLDMLGGFRNEN